MPLLDLVEYLDPTGNVLAARVPREGSGELRLGSQCVVREGQMAFFVRDGRLLDMLTPGRHTLSTHNIPLLVELIKLPFGNKSPFRADVYYVNLHQLTDLKWGTPQPILMRDSQFGMVRLRAFGSYVIQVGDPRRLLTEVVGTRGLYTVQDVEEHLRSSINSRMADVLGEYMRERKLSVLDLATEYDELSALTHMALKNDFCAMGIELKRFYINTISVPEDLERRLDQVGGVAAFGGIADYTRFKSAEAIQDAARSGSSSIAGVGVGLGAGASLAAAMTNTITSTVNPGSQSASSISQCGKCGTASPVAAKFCSECGASLKPVTCAGCGSAGVPGSKFCSECGGPLRP